jgi:hypothetical protein
MIWVALAIVFTIGGPFTANAQGGRGRVAEPYTPAEDAKDLKAVLFRWMWGEGMLKGHDERDMVASLEYQGKGTIQVEGQPCTLTAYRASTNYQTFSQRIQYACTKPSGEKYSNIEVVSGLYAWNEDKPGAEIASTKGTVTPMPATVQERLIRLWASPQGAPKAAVAGTTDKFWLGANPGTLIADGLMKAGQTSVSWENGQPVVTFPIPGVPGATATAALDAAKYTTQRVVVKQGANTTEFTHGDYQDWNNPLNKIGVLYAGKMTERRNGAAVPHAATERASGPDGQLVVERLDWELHDGRRAPMQPMAVKSRLQPAIQPDGRFRALLAIALWQSGASHLQAGELGQSAAARHVDEQV